MNVSSGAIPVKKKHNIRYSSIGEDRWFFKIIGLIFAFVNELVKASNGQEHENSYNSHKNL